jgi:hypothetical protein
MTMADVKSSEPEAPTLEQDGLLVYGAQIGGLQCDLVYIFATDRLVRAKYLLGGEHASALLFLRDFQTLKDLLAQKYGEPQDEGEVWNDDFYKNDPEQWGMAISKGDHSRYVTWKHQGTTTCLAIWGDNFKVMVAIEYKGDSLAKLEEAEQTRRDLESL